MKEKSQKASAIVFFTFLLFFMLFSVFFFKDEKSELENRSLAKMPKLNKTTYLDASFAKGTEEFLNDHFPLRTDWISLRTGIELLSGKSEINGIYITDERLLEKTAEPDYAISDASAEAINKFAKKHPDSSVYVMLAPTSACVYSDELSPEAPQYNLTGLTERVYDELDESIVKLDVYKTMYGVRDEYIYYRNDHHWTALGAYYAYNYAVSRLGFNPVAYNSFNIEHANNNFRGTFFSKTLYSGCRPDSIDIYSCESGTQISSLEINDGMKIETYDSLYFKDYLKGSDMYSMYLGGNHPLVTIKTNSQSGKKLLLIKDSYANSFVPFLAQHYSEITMLDMRYISVAPEAILDVDEYRQVMILYNISGFAADTDLRRIGS